MASQQFTMERSVLLRDLGGGRQTFNTSEDINAEWLDERGDALGDAEFEEVGLPPVEWPGEDRSIIAAARDQIIMSRTPPPDDARSIRFRRGRRSATFDAQSVPEPWVTERTTRVFGSDQKRYELPIFSELFTDFDRFQGKVEALYQALRSVAPFSQVEGAGKLRLVGYYARSPGPNGHFQTVIKTEKGERRVNGKLGYARSRLANALAKMPALILIDSDVAGGAGGVLNAGKPYWPAWASLGSMAANATWEEVAIHEIAHGFGLSDEYIDAAMAASKDQPERYNNVSDARLASALAWNDLAKLPDTTPLPTHDDSGAPIDGNNHPSVVAAYQGAFYSLRNWRPSPNCRMRNYDPGDFCQVCSRVIRRLYDMPDR